MSTATASTTELIETFIHDVDACKKCFQDKNRPTKVELTRLFNLLRENLANIPNPSCIGGLFELSICITNGAEWLQAEMGRINQQRFEAAEQQRATDNATKAASNLAVDNSIVTYTPATEGDCNPYPKIKNPGQFVIDSNKTADQITIAKIKHDMKLKEYAALTVVDSAIQYFLRNFFGVELFADMNINDNFVLNKYSALQMRNHLKSKYNKLNPMHVKDVYTEFELPPTSGSPISLYFVRQNRCISILADTDEPVTDPKRLRTLLGHLQAIPAMQQPVDDYNKKILSDGAMSWNDTRNFSSWKT